MTSRGSAAYAVAPPFMQAPGPVSEAPRGTSWRNFAAVSFSGAILTLTGYAFLSQVNTSVGDAPVSTAPQALPVSASARGFDDAKQSAQYVPAELAPETVSAPVTQPPT